MNDGWVSYLLSVGLFTFTAAFTFSFACSLARSAFACGLCVGSTPVLHGGIGLGLFVDTEVSAVVGIEALEDHGCVGCLALALVEGAAVVGVVLGDERCAACFTRGACCLLLGVAELAVSVLVEVLEDLFTVWAAVSAVEFWAAFLAVAGLGNCAEGADCDESGDECDLVECLFHMFVVVCFFV